MARASKFTTAGGNTVETYPIEEYHQAGWDRGRYNKGGWYHGAYDCAGCGESLAYVDLAAANRGANDHAQNCRAK